MDMFPPQASHGAEARPFEHDPTVYKALLESTKAIPWKIDWATMKFTYIGPQIEPLLGWPQDSWVTVDDWALRMHPEDRDAVVGFCVAQSQAGVDHEADYRALTADGEYVWIRDVVHVVRKDDGQVDCLIGFMFDISARKQADDELMVLKRELEHLSLTDGLTGISNRRMFDTCLDKAWGESRRTRNPMSFLVLDIDFFKQFNDYYGHVRGDECLREIAGVLKRVARREEDVAARYGGEEFILLLPDTNGATAYALAEKCAHDIAALKIPHETSGISGYVTVSIGVGTVVAEPGKESRDFVEAVDRMLYAAKSGGRNRIEVVMP